LGKTEKREMEWYEVTCKNCGSMWRVHRVSGRIIGELELCPLCSEV